MLYMNTDRDKRDKRQYREKNGRKEGFEEGEKER